MKLGSLRNGDDADRVPMVVKPRADITQTKDVPCEHEEGVQTGVYV